MPGLFDAASNFLNSVFSVKSGESQRIQQQITQQENNISIFDTENQGYIDEISDYETTMFSFEVEEQTFQAQLSETQQAITTAQTNVASAQNMLSKAMSIQPKVTKNEDGTETTDTSERDAAIEEAQKALETAQKELEEATQSNIKAQEEADKIAQQISELNEKINEVKGKSDITQAQIDEAQNELNSLKEELNNLQKQDEQGKDNITEVNNEEMQRMNDVYLTLTNVDPDRKVSDTEIAQAKRKAQIIADSDYDESNPAIAKYVETAKLLASEEMNDKPEDGNVYNPTQLKIRSNMREVTTDYLKDLGYTDKTALAVANMYLELGHYEEGYDTKYHGGFEGEESSNAGIMVDKYFENISTQQGLPWCATFVSWLYGEGQADPEGNNILPKKYNQDTFGYVDYVPTLEAKADEAGYFTPVDKVNNNKYAPVAGDIMIQEEHTGMVVGSDDKYIYTIEGNAGNKVRARKYARDGEKYKTIRGFIRMNEWTGGTKKPQNVFLMDFSKFENADKNKNQSTL